MGGKVHGHAVGRTKAVQQEMEGSRNNQITWLEQLTILGP